MFLDKKLAQLFLYSNRLSLTVLLFMSPSQLKLNLHRSTPFSHSLLVAHHLSLLVTGVDLYDQFPWELWLKFSFFSHNFLSPSILFSLLFFCPPPPLQNVIDGDLCEQFNSMDPHKQKSVAEELDKTPPEVSKKLEDIRTRYAF